MGKEAVLSGTSRHPEGKLLPKAWIQIEQLTFRGGDAVSFDFQAPKPQWLATRAQMDGRFELRGLPVGAKAWVGASVCGAQEFYEKDLVGPEARRSN